MNAAVNALRFFFLTGLYLSVSSLAYAGSKVVAYVPNWVDLQTFAPTIDYAKLTHINVAFENPVNDQGELSFNKGDEFLIARAKEKGVKILVSIGGGDASEDSTLLKRYARLLEKVNRPAFVAKLADFVSTHKFDGLDVDIEGPSITGDYSDFVIDLAKALRPQGKLLTAALSEGYGGHKVPPTIFQHLDWINIMAYDATGPWEPKSPGPSASMQFAKDNVSYWLGRGVPKSKAVLGVPFYGYGFGKAFRKRDYAYRQIVTTYPGAEKMDQVGSTIYYNGIPTIKAKAQYVLDQGLAGIMIWSLDDDATGEKSLLAAIHETLFAKPRTLQAHKK